MRKSDCTPLISFEKEIRRRTRETHCIPSGISRNTDSGLLALVPKDTLDLKILKQMNCPIIIEGTLNRM
jgi:hypothetical protein